VSGEVTRRSRNDDEQRAHGNDGSAGERSPAEPRCLPPCAGHAPHAPARDLGEPGMNRHAMTMWSADEENHIGVATLSIVFDDTRSHLRDTCVSARPGRSARPAVGSPDTRSARARISAVAVRRALGMRSHSPLKERARIR
jgi:hypothetical protein